MKIKTKAIISLLVIIFFILIANTKVQAKSYYIDDMQIEATVQNNGDLQIEQTLKYAFNGEYNGIYITIPTKYKNQEEVISKISNDIYNASGVFVQDVSLIEDSNEYHYSKVGSAINGNEGVYTTENTYNSCKIKVYSPSVDTKKTFKIKYILQNVCVEHNDVGELYYNFIGGDWQCSIKNLDIDIFLPNNQEDIKIWGHGPDNGYSKIIDNTHAYFNVKNVPTGKYVATRVVFDKSNILSTTKKSNLNAYNLIYQDEQNIAKISDAKKGYTRNIYIFALVLLIYWIILLIIYEKDKKIKLVPYNEDELFKKYNPMLAGCLQGSRDILARDIIGVILNLIEKGNMKFKIDGYSSETTRRSYKLYTVSKNPEKENQMDEIEKMVYDWVFQNADKVELSQRLQNMPKEKDANERFKKLNNATQEKLNTIGANQKKVPVFIRVFHTFLFFFTVYISVKHILYEGMEIYDTWSLISTIFIMLIYMLPITMLVIYGVLKIIITVRKKVNKLINKITGQRVVTTTVAIIVIFLIIIILTALFSSNANKYIIADEVLICISLIIMLTDNLMMKNSIRMIEDFSKINCFKDKIENYTMMEDRDIEQVTIWGKYLAYAVSFGIADKIRKRIKDLSLDDDLLELLNNEDILEYIMTDYSFFYYNADLDSRFVESYGKTVGTMISEIGSGSSRRSEADSQVVEAFLAEEAHGGGRRRFLVQICAN